MECLTLAFKFSHRVGWGPTGFHEGFISSLSAAFLWPFLAWSCSFWHAVSCTCVGIYDPVFREGGGGLSCW